VFDRAFATRVANEKLADMGIMVRDADQAVGTMSGGERQCLAIARAIHFGARVLILDEPTAALGVKQSANVLRIVARAREKGISVIFITHNVHHAYPVGDTFTLLNRGRWMGTFHKTEISRDEVLNMMAGGQEMQQLMVELGVRL
jgi:simple sugar transport system ATP-binding protein